MTTKNQQLKIGITVGDINGIGLEVALKTLADKRILQWCTPVLYGSTKVVSYHKNIAKIRDLSLHNAADVQSLNPNAINVINCWMENVKITLGKCTVDGGKYATFSLEQATADLKAGHLDALVTAPIHKKAMQDSGFAFPGHTEYLTDKFQAPLNLMLLVNESLRVGLVTNHLPVQQVAATITQSLVLDKIRLMDQTLRMDFGVDRPAIAVLGLNPHAGDGGVLGTEEIEHILPAIEQAKSEGILAIGPYAADGFFGSANYANFDGILAMYHDQGLVPFKALSFGKGINFTAGLPIIRTSPDHGTGFDIAGKNTANPQSFREALYLAMDSARQRADYHAMHKNALPKDTQELDEAATSKGEAKRKKNQDSPKNRRESNERSKGVKNKPANAPQKKGTPSKEPDQPQECLTKATGKKAQQAKKTTGAPKQEQQQPPIDQTIEERLAKAAEKKAQQAKKTTGAPKQEQQQPPMDQTIEERLAKAAEKKAQQTKESAPPKTQQETRSEKGDSVQPITTSAEEVVANKEGNDPTS